MSLMLDFVMMLMIASRGTFKENFSLAKNNSFFFDSLHLLTLIGNHSAEFYLYLSNNLKANTTSGNAISFFLIRL